MTRPHFGPILRSFFRRPLATIPEYPLRCQHCCEHIKLYSVGHDADGPAFIDPYRSVVCDPMADHIVFHHPMPIVLG